MPPFRLAMPKIDTLAKSKLPNKHAKLLRVEVMMLQPTPGQKVTSSNRGVARLRASSRHVPVSSEPHIAFLRLFFARAGCSPHVARGVDAGQFGDKITLRSFTVSPSTSWPFHMFVISPGDEKFQKAVFRRRSEVILETDYDGGYVRI
jgi:hypothetical protein